MRIRTIKPEFWRSERMCCLRAETRLLALGLLNYADDEGYFLAHPALIRGELMPFVESTAGIAAMLEELVEIEYVRIGEDEKKRKIGLVVNFQKHQLVNRPQRSKLAGLVGFPEWSPRIPGILSDETVNAQGSIPDDSVNAQGSINGGMDQGSGNGRDQGMEEEGIREGNGEPSPASALRAPVGDLAAVPLAGSSMPEGRSAICNAENVEVEAAETDLSLDSVAAEPALGAKKKRGAGTTEPEPVTNRRSQQKKGGGPEWPEDLAEEYRVALGPWWGYKRERKQGYTPAGWAALIRQQVLFPAGQVRMSVEASMAANWAGLFTERHGGTGNYRTDFGAQKKGAGAGQQVLVEDTSAPAGFERGCEALYGEVTPWAMLGEGQQGEVREWLRRNGMGKGVPPCFAQGSEGQAGAKREGKTGGLRFECPPPCDWRVVWDEIYGPLPSPEMWEGVHDVARRQIVARIEAKKRKGGLP